MDAKAWEAIRTAFTVIGGLWALWIYHSNLRLKRAEWLQKLHQQFYESERYRKVREILDYRPRRELAELHEAVAADASSQLATDLFDYLNFFEFVAGFAGLKQLQKQDVQLAFDYPLRMIARDDVVMAQVDSQGYESLGTLLREFGYTLEK